MKPESGSWAYYLAGAVGQYAESAKTEIERLRAEVAEWQRAADHNARIVADQRDQLVKLGAELDRLRAAIRGLLRTGTGLSDYQAAAKRAREALGDE